MFLLLTFLMPFFFVLCQRYTGLPVLQLLFYGLEAASPSIAALLVLSKNRQLLSFFKKNFKGWKSGTALLFPCEQPCPHAARKAVRRFFFIWTFSEL